MSPDHSPTPSFLLLPVPQIPNKKPHPQPGKQDDGNQGDDVDRVQRRCLVLVLGLARNAIPVYVAGKVLFKGHQGFPEQLTGGGQISLQLPDPFFEVLGLFFLFVEFVLLHDVPEDTHGAEFLCLYC